MLIYKNWGISATKPSTNNSNIDKVGRRFYGSCVLQLSFQLEIFSINNHLFSFQLHFVFLRFSCLLSGLRDDVIVAWAAWRSMTVKCPWTFLQ